MVRIVALIFRAVKRFKEYGMRRKVRKGEADVSDLNKLQNEGKEEVKFSIFSVSEAEYFDSKINEGDPVNLSDMITSNGVSLKSNPEADLNVLDARKKLYIKLTDGEISVALEYLFKKATQEIVEFYNMKEIDKVGYFKDEILVSKCRLLEDQELKIVGGLEDFLDLDNFIGLKSCVPLISKHSPLAVSIAMHMHYNVNKHVGAETTYRMSLLNVRILGGKQLFKEVSNDLSIA